MPVTIRDVAREAGVSITTVSRALNGGEDVGPQTRERILEVAQRLRYRPSHVARSLVRQQTESVGILVSDFNKDSGGHHFMFDVLAGIHDQLSEYGYDVVLMSTNTARQRMVSYVDFCTERRLEGVVVMGLRLDDPYFSELVDSLLPTVAIDLPVLSEHCGYVMSDNINGAKFAVKHLLSKGHRKIAFVNGHQQAAVSLDRLRGYQEAMWAAGITDLSNLVINSDFTYEGGVEATQQLLHQCPDVTAVFYASDLMAIGGMKGLSLAGRRVPDDVAVVGFDNIDLGAIVTPALTTVGQRRYPMGQTAVSMLYSMLRDGDAPTGRLLAPELVVRSST